LRDTAEAQRDFAFYTNYLAVFIPALQTILGEEKTIAFGREAYDHRYRHTLLTWLLRLPHTDPFKPFEAGVMGLMVKLIKAENEENALICIKIMIDGFRAHKVSHHFRIGEEADRIG
jgi:transformation/transcription domain-associated protein